MVCDLTRNKHRQTNSLLKMIIVNFVFEIKPLQVNRKIITIVINLFLYRWYFILFLTDGKLSSLYVSSNLNLNLKQNSWGRCSTRQIFRSL